MNYKLYVFPSQNQDQATQDADEIACYKWAMEQTGHDPINPPPDLEKIK